MRNHNLTLPGSRWGQHVHASEHLLNGVFCVQVDMTNIPDYGITGDALALRPFEVLVQVRHLKISRATPGPVHIAPTWKVLQTTVWQADLYMLQLQRPPSLARFMQGMKAQPRICIPPELPDSPPSLLESWGLRC